MNKFLFILRCYSGFEQSLIKKEWSPSGATTIAKTIEYIQNDKSSNLIIVSNNFNSKLGFIRNRKLYLKKLNMPIHFIMGKLLFLSDTKLGKYYTFLYNNISILLYILKYKPKLVYSDHANIFITAFISRFLGIKTMVRLMGIKDDMRNSLIETSFYYKLLRWSYRSPFSMVLATQDGAGSENWMKSALKKNVPNITILNGVDQKNKLTNTKLLKNIPNNKFIAIFVGRLEHDKAPDKFIESFLLAKKKLPNNLHIIIVGTGSMKEKLDLSLEKANATKDVTFFSNLNTDEIFFLLDKSDVYISLNRYGNLSNTNIEAMTRGKAMIIPRSNRYKGIDIYTDSLIPRDSVIRIKDSDSINDVAEALIYLFNNEKAKISLEKNISNISNQYIKSWDKRIAWEFKLLNIINSGRQDKLRSFIEDVEL